MQEFDQILTWPAEDYSRVPYRVFTDQDIFEAEQERIWKGPVWNYLALEAEIPNPGDFLVTYVGDTPVVVNRAEDGSIHAWVNRCAHRGTMVVREPRGNRTSHTCVYHHWCYDLKGNLIGVPFQKGSQGQGGMPKSFRKEDHGLQTYKIATHAGVIFGATHPDVEPLEDYVGEPGCQMLDRLFGKDIEILGYMRQRMPANWKVYWENLNDGYHAGLLHQLAVVFGISRLTQEGGMILDKKQRHTLSYALSDSDDEAAIRAGGYDNTTLYDNQLTLEDPSLVGFIDEYDDRHVLSMLTVFPSIFFQQMSNTLATRQIRPKNPDEFELYWTCFGYKDDSPELRKARIQQFNIAGPAGLVSMEDGESGVLIQRAIRRQGEFHSVVEMGGVGDVTDQTNLVTEVPIHGFWRFYCEIMGFNQSRARSAAE